MRIASSFALGMLAGVLLGYAIFVNQRSGNLLKKENLSERPDESLMSAEGRARSTEVELSDHRAVPPPLIEPESLTREELAFQRGKELVSAGSSWNEAFQLLKTASERGAFAAGMVQAWPAYDLGSLELELRRMAPGYARETALSALVERIAEFNPTDAIRLATETLSGPSLYNSVSAVAESWGRNSATEALRWAATNRTSQFANQIIEMAAVGGARSDPAATLAAIQVEPGLSNEQRNQAYAALVGVWAIDDPVNALNAGREIFRQSGAPEPLTNGLLNLATQNPLAAMQAASTVDPTVRSVAVPQILGVWANQDPQAASRWAANLAQSDSQRNVAVSSVATAWAETDARGALSWALSLPLNDPSRNAAVQQVAVSWDRFDQNGLETFAQTLSPADLDTLSNSLAASAGTDGQ